METPRISIKAPRVTKPEDGDSSGQLLAMYRRKSPISVMMSPTVSKISNSQTSVQYVVTYLRYRR